MKSMVIQRWISFCLCLCLCLCLFAPAVFGADPGKIKPSYSKELKDQLNGLSKTLYLNVSINPEGLKAGLDEKEIRSILRREFKNSRIQVADSFQSPMVTVNILTKSLNDTTGKFHMAAVTAQLVERMTSTERSSVNQLMGSVWEQSAIVVFGDDKAALIEAAKSLVRSFAHDYSLANH